MQERKKTAQRPKKLVLITSVTLLVIVGLIVAFILLKPEERSVAAYCKVYNEENARLASAQGDTYSVAVFPHSSSDPADFVSAFGNLERVAPEELHSDVNTLKQVFQKIDGEASLALGASLSGIPAESEVEEFTRHHCKQKL